MLLRQGKLRWLCDSVQIYELLQIIKLTATGRYNAKYEKLKFPTLDSITLRIIVSGKMLRPYTFFRRFPG